MAALPDAGQQMQVLTPDLRQRIMARGDRVFRAERYLLGCVSKGPFGSVNEVTQRIGEVLAVVAAIPASVRLSACIQKTGARNRVEALRIADERGWLSWS